MHPKILPAMIYVIFLWRHGVALPPYYADAPPDCRAIAAMDGIASIVWRTAYLRYD